MTEVGVVMSSATAFARDGFAILPRIVAASSCDALIEDLEALPLSEVIRDAAASRKLPCVVERGGVVVLRPLLIHSSAKGRTAGSRRVLHFLYGPPLTDT